MREKPRPSSPRQVAGRQYAIRCGDRDVVLHEGDTILGRGTACDLVLDDSLVSRRHACLHIEGGTVTLVDLGSRNGIIVNGHPIAGRSTLRPGDRLNIGSFLLTLVEPSPLALQEGARSSIEFDPARTMRAASSPVLPDEEVTACTAENFELLADMAEKALAAGRADEVSRILFGHLERLARECESGKYLPKDTLLAVARYAVKLSDATGQAGWLELMLRIYYAQSEPLPLPAVDSLYRILRRVRGLSRTLLKNYIERLHENAPRLGPAERFASKRIEGLLQIMVE